MKPSLKLPTPVSTDGHHRWRRLSVAIIGVVIVSGGASLVLLSRPSDAPSAIVDRTSTGSVQQSSAPVITPSPDPSIYTTPPPNVPVPTSQAAISSDSTGTPTPTPRRVSTPARSDTINVTGLRFSVATCAVGPQCLLYTRSVAAPATTRNSPYLSQAGYPGCPNDPAIAIELAFTFAQYPNGAAPVNAYLDSSLNGGPFDRDPYRLGTMAGTGVMQRFTWDFYYDDGGAKPSNSPQNPLSLAFDIRWTDSSGRHRVLSSTFFFYWHC